MFRGLGQKKKYRATDSFDMLPADDASLTAEIQRLEGAGECEQLRSLLLLSSRSTGLPVPAEHCRALLGACLRERDAATADAFIMGGGAHTSSPQVLRMALRVFSAAGAADRARDLLHILAQLGESPSVHDYSLLLHAAAVNGSTDAVASIAEEIQKKGFPLTKDYYNLVLKACVRNRDLERALAVFDQMLSRGERPDRYTWGLLVQAHIEEGDIAGAEDMLRRALDEQPAAVSVRLFNQLMKAHGDAGDPEAAYAWLDRLLALSTGARPGPTKAGKPSPAAALTPNEYSFGICLAVAAAAGDKPRVLALVEALYRAGLGLNHATWRTATAPFGKTLDAEGLRKIIGC